VTTGVHVEIDGVMKNLKEMEDLITAKDRDIMRYGRSIMKSETNRAFSSKVDPNTGRGWVPRKESYPWPMLNNTGAMLGSLAWGYGIKTKDRRLKFFGKVAGDQGAIIRAGATHFGRSKARSEKGTKLWGQAPSTGATPARPFFGFGRSARKRIKRYAEKRLAKVFK
jgi:phage gpG-like protein